MMKNIICVTLLFSAPISIKAMTDDRDNPVVADPDEQARVTMLALSTAADLKKLALLRGDFGSAQRCEKLGREMKRVINEMIKDTLVGHEDSDSHEKKEKGT